jgi:hypothetical protein
MDQSYSISVADMGTATVDISSGGTDGTQLRTYMFGVGGGVTYVLARIVTAAAGAVTLKLWKRKDAAITTNPSADASTILIGTCVIPTAAVANDMVAFPIATWGDTDFAPGEIFQIELDAKSSGAGSAWIGFQRFDMMMIASGGQPPIITNVDLPLSALGDLRIVQGTEN